jgi:hypothetical protein
MRIKQYYLNAGLVLTALTVLALGYPAMAHDEVPVKGKETGAVISDVLPFAFPFAFDRMTGIGKATHIGHYTLSGDLVANVIFGTAVGTFTMTAANGDMLFLDAEGFVVPTDLTQLVWNFTVTGGTGRFEGATGSFTTHVQLAAVVGILSPNSYTAEFRGTLCTRDKHHLNGHQEDDGLGHGDSGRHEK